MQLAPPSVCKRVNKSDDVSAKGCEPVAHYSPVAEAVIAIIVVGWRRFFPETRCHRESTIMQAQQKGNDDDYDVVTANCTARNSAAVVTSQNLGVHFVHLE